MASYAQDVKNELSRKLDDDRDCRRAEFVALMKVGAKKIDGRLEFTSSNAAVVRRVITLAKKFFPHVKPEVAAVRRKKLLKNLLYVVRFIIAGEVQNFFDTLDFNELLKRTRFKAAYLRGAFLAGGSVNRPEKKTHLEIAFATERAAAFAQKIFKIFDMRAGLYERRGLFVTYIKENDLVCDFIGIIGAEKAVEHFEIARNVKEVRAMVNRIVNCETANLNRAVDAAGKQIADIRLLIEKNVEVEDYIKETMKFRLKYPDDSISELAAKMYLSKQGLLYRLKNIHELAESVRE